MQLLKFYALAFLHLIKTSSVEPIVLQDYCPYTNLCSADSQYTLTDPDATPCCLQCSCEDDCYDFQNCCPDKPLTVHPPPLSCRIQDEIYALHLYRHLSENTISGHRLRVIDRCPLEALGQENIESTVDKCFNGRTLEDLTFVSDAKEKIYFNRFCAECNGIYEYTTWKLVALCKRLLGEYFSSVEEMTEFLIRSCPLISMPPPGLVLVKPVCPMMSEKRCNVTGLWDDYNEEVELNCHQYDVNYVVNEFESYANIFCYICNMPRESVFIQTECKGYNISWIQEPDPIFSGLVPFAAIINLQADQLPLVNDVSTEACSFIEVINPLTGVCTGLFCPNGTFPSHGECKSLVDSVQGYCLGIRLGIDMENKDDLILDRHKLKLMVATKQLLLKTSRTRGIDCGLGALTLEEHYDGKLSVSVSMFSTSKCTHIELLQLCARLAREPSITVRVDGGEEILPIYAMEDGDIKQILWIEEHTDHLDCTQFTMNTISCPSIHISLTEIVNSMDKMTNVDLSELIGRAVNIELELFQICLADCRQILEQRPSSASCNVNNVILLICTILPFY